MSYLSTPPPSYYFKLGIKNILSHLLQLQALLPTMRSAILCAIGFCAAVFSQSAVVDRYVVTESPIAKARLLANIGPSGSKSSGAAVRILRKS